MLRRMAQSLSAGFVLSVLLIAGATAEIACTCSEQSCICFIQMGDEGIAVKGIIASLSKRGYLKKNSGSMFDDEVYEAVCMFQLDAGLPQTGMMDDETLSQLLHNQNLNSSDHANVVWVPTDGGRKRHSNPDCSNMYDPRKISEENAVALKIEPCKRCNK